MYGQCMLHEIWNSDLKSKMSWRVVVFKVRIRVYYNEKVRHFFGYDTPCNLLKARSFYISFSKFAGTCPVMDLSMLSVRLLSASNIIVAFD